MPVYLTLSDLIAILAFLVLYAQYIQAQKKK